MSEIIPHPVGTCKVCGCVEDHACYDADYGACWWIDETETLCSHCADASHPDSLQTLILMDKEPEEELW
ncbi:MAG: hypothetical protein E6772_16780 [Dysgonomonas sp.]|nr:hypothetical protein [Dysgonomonas sp.]